MVGTYCVNCHLYTASIGNRCKTGTRYSTISVLLHRVKEGSSSVALNFSFFLPPEVKKNAARAKTIIEKELHQTDDNGKADDNEQTTEGEIEQNKEEHPTPSQILACESSADRVAAAKQRIRPHASSFCSSSSSSSSASFSSSSSCSSSSSSSCCRCNHQHQHQRQHLDRGETRAEGVIVTVSDGWGTGCVSDALKQVCFIL